MAAVHEILEQNQALMKKIVKLGDIGILILLS